MGQALLVCISTGDTVSTVTWNGASLVKDAEAGSAANAHSYIYSLTNATAGTGNLVVTFTAAPAKGNSVTAIAVSDLATASMLDKISVSTGSSAAPSSAATAVTTQADEFVYGCVSVNGVIDASPAWTNDFSAGQSNATSGAGANSNWAVYEGYKNVNATAAQTATMTLATSRPWAAAVATYKKSGMNCQTYDGCSKAGAIEVFNVGKHTMRWCDGSIWRQFQTP